MCALEWLVYDKKGYPVAKPVTKKECLYLLCDRRRYKESYYCLHHNGQYVKYGVEGMSSLKHKRKSFCSYESCEKPPTKHGLCTKHFKMVKVGVKELECSVYGCNQVAISKKLCHRHEILTRRYQISPIALSQMVISADGRCGICGGLPGQKGLHIDHDRSCCDKIGSCGQCIRELICNRCNVALAHVNESADLMTKAIEYLRRDYSILHIEDERHVDRTTTAWEHRWARYRVGANRYKYLEDSHDGRCAICKEEWSFMHIDHDHETGHVRGALCRECNLYLGDVKDSNDTILSMIQYVKRHKMEMVE